MGCQSEARLEKEMIDKLIGQGYENIVIKDEKDLNKNFKLQLEKLNREELDRYNKKEFTEDEFNKILIYLNNGTLFKKSEILRDKYELKNENETIYIKFIDEKNYSKNIYQVSNQITMFGRYENRYDVTILINGLPLVQIELKKRGLEIKEAFNQIKRYEKHSLSGLFNYVQIFVISNGVNTKYFSNNKEKEFKFTFFWTDIENKKISNLNDFTDIFLEREHLYKMITKYIVLNHTHKELMVLRPYQYYAVESIIDKVENTKSNGYIWHSTGSGKTLTSYKASQLLTESDKVDKVIFVVDRRDLDTQTSEEFNSFSTGAVDRTENTKILVNQLQGTNKLIVTTIQKLNRAIDSERYESKMSPLKDKKIVMIFDECHRSQFGDMHKKIVKFFNNIQCFGFTGTPIFSKNATKYKTTKDVFGECLHKYLIKNAINDENVLGFGVEYIGRYVDKTKNQPDIEVEAIDTKEVMESEQRMSLITDYIINIHNAKTYNKEFTGIFAVSSIEVLYRYYELFKAKKHDLKVVAVFSFGANEEDDGSGEHSRDKLENCIKDYNEMFDRNCSTDVFGKYCSEVGDKVKEKKIDILLVVNMFLTGFDSKSLNTLYVDKNLQYHGLLQAFSRTNRVFNDKKKQGNIVCFRNLKSKVDESIKLYSDENALETVLMKPYKEYVADFKEVLMDMREQVLEVAEVDNLESEDEKLKFVKRFRELLRLHTRLSTYTEFDFNDLDIQEQTFADYRSKYLDLYESIGNGPRSGKTSILEDIDFEIELLQRDDINVNYILKLVQSLDKNSSSFEKDKKFILNVMDKDIKLRSKKELLEKFIESNIVNINSETEFDSFIEKEKRLAIYNLIEKENLKEKEISEVFRKYEEKEYSLASIKSKIKESFFTKPGIKELKTKVDLIANQVSSIVERFNW